MNIKKAIFLILLPVIAHSADDVLTVDDVSCYAESSSLDQAKIEALHKCYYKAAGVLVKRIMPIKSIEKEAEILNSFDEQKWVESYDLIEEKMNSNSYKATINVKFAQAPVQAALIKNGVKYRFTWGPKTIVLSHTEGQEEDPMQKAFARLPEHYGLLHFIIPLEDLQEISAVNLMYKPNPEYKDFQPLLDKYSADEVLIVWASITNKKLLLNISSITMHGTEKQNFTYDILDQNSYAVAAEKIAQFYDTKLKGYNSVIANRR